MKKRLIFITMFLLLFVNIVCVSADNDNMIFNTNGIISLTDENKLASNGDSVTITVVTDDVNWFDENVADNGDIEKVVWYDEGNFNLSSKCEFSFYLSQNGQYKAYISSKCYDEPKEIDFTYINKPKFDAALSAICNAIDNNVSDSDFYNIVWDNQEQLGLFDNIFDITDKTETAKVFRNELKNADGQKRSELTYVIETLKKSAVVGAYNGNKNIEVNEINKIINNENVNTYYNDNISEYLKAYVTGKSFKTINEFDLALNEGVILGVVNFGNSQNIKRVLSDNAGFLNISKDVITESKCLYLSSNPCNSIAKLKEYLNTSDGKKSGSSGGGSNSKTTGERQTVNTPERIETDTVTFDDISDVGWAKDAIIGLYNMGAVSGKENNKFYPNDNITREEFVKILMKVFDINLINEDIPFNDVDKGHWSYNYIRSAYLCGVVNGIDASTFGIGTNITRQDLCVMIYRAYKLNAEDAQMQKNAEVVFSDGNSISDYAIEAVDYFAAAGILNGDENGCFNPYNSATRAEAAKIIFGVKEKSDKK